MQPVVAALRRHYGDEATLDLVCLRRCQPAAELLSGLNQVHVVQRGTGEIVDALKSRKFDYLLDLHRTVRSRSLGRSLNILTFAVDKQAWQRWLLIRGWRTQPVTGFIDRCFAALTPFSINVPPANVYGPEAWGKLNVDKDIAPDVRGSIVVSLGSSQPGKHLSDEIVIGVIEEARTFKTKVFLVGGNDEKGRAEHFAAEYSHVYSYAGIWNLSQTAGAISQAHAIVTGDSVTMHIGAATGSPLAAIWGCTRPSLGLDAWRAHPASINLLPNMEAPNRPCSKHGSSCRKTSSTDPFDGQRCSQMVRPENLRQWLRDCLNHT